MKKAVVIGLTALLSTAALADDIRGNSARDDCSGSAEQTSAKGMPGMHSGDVTARGDASTPMKSRYESLRSIDNYGHILFDL